MIIGIDFDNTIINYDSVFASVALEYGTITDPGLKSKNDVKKYLITSDREADWTELQGKVYGTHIMKATPFDDVIQTFSWLLAQGHKLKIISHKTKYPFIGDRVKLREAAMSWLKSNDIVGKSGNKIHISDIYFCDTVNSKVEQITKQKCDIFIDDLTSVLDQINSSILKILFDPNSMSFEKNKQSFTASSWKQIGSYINAL